MTLFELLTDESETGLDIPVAYSHFDNQQGSPDHIEPPYLLYIGNGQDNFKADNNFYWSRNRYQVEYYFTKKDESLEDQIEQMFKDHGLLYEKSEDVYIEEEGVFVIYYTI